MKKKINDNVTWIGKTDWELKKFHGDEFTTTKGSSYNAYLIQDEEMRKQCIKFGEEFAKI